MKTKENIQQELSNLKNKKEYYSWYEENQDEVMIDSFPHTGIYSKFSNESYTPKEKLQYQSYFPFKEQIQPGELFLNGENYVAPWVKEKFPIMWYGWDGCEMHYSTNPKVWRWDWERAREKVWYNGNISNSIDFLIKGLSDHDLIIMRDKFKKKGIQIKIIPDPQFKSKICLRARLSSKKYLKFREALLELSIENKIRTSYEYEEIRNVVTNKRIEIIA